MLAGAVETPLVPAPLSHERAVYDMWMFFRECRALIVFFLREKGGGVPLPFTHKPKKVWFEFEFERSADAQS
jgi:hypothetical protein